MANIWRHVFTWCLPVMCLVISAIGFVEYFSSENGRGLLASIVFMVFAVFIAVINVKLLRSGYFDE